ncbi:MAG: DegT/DnrJ/EryC1/StrS family aminotransferase [Candidatus Omnitrophica bacterium]|nr:DegT/DnrJ/EryC1/StrS family aminotransferase [Candidatus Omnitrophota bacterium]
MDCLETGWISSAGSYIEKFERTFADYIGTKHGISVSSGTAALHAALCALGIQPGDEVIVPAFTMMATIFAVLYTGAKPVFVDCDQETFNIDPRQIEAKITRKTKALMAVHLFGHSCDMDTILEIAKRFGLFVIEDAAEAHGGEYKGRKCGAMSDIACFSFYANKIVTTGEGGMILTNSDALAKKLRKIRDLYHSDQRRFIHEDIGYNYRLTNIQAAIGLGQLENVQQSISRKLSMAERYRSQLTTIPGIRTPVTRPEVKNVYWMYVILIEKEKFGISKDELRIRLRDYQIDSRDLFYPPHRQPVLQKYLTLTEIFPNTEYASQNGCYLPSGLAITDDEIDRVCQTIATIRSTLS